MVYNSLKGVAVSRSKTVILYSNASCTHATSPMPVF